MDTQLKNFGLIKPYYVTLVNKYQIYTASYFRLLNLNINFAVNKVLEE